MDWLTILYVAMAALSATIAVIYFAAWMMQRQAWSYLIFALLAVSIAALAATELWMLSAETPSEYATALRWFQVPIWSGILALVGLVHLRLRPRFFWVGGLAVGLRTVALVANFVTGSNLNYIEVTHVERYTLLGQPVATAVGIPNPWMLVGQTALVVLIFFLLDAGISAWRRGEALRSLVLTISLLLAVVVGTAQAVMVFWGFARLPVLITPLFLFVAAVMGGELSFGLLRAARAERDIKIKDAALSIGEHRLALAAEAADAGFWSLDAGSGKIWSTPKTRELLGLPADSDLSLDDFLKRVHQLDRTRLANLIDVALYSDQRYRTEFRVVDADGGVRWLAGLGSTVARTEIGAKPLMGVMVNITERKAMQAKILRQRAQLDRLSKVETLAELSASLAHELSQPLAMILANAEAAQALLAKSPPDMIELRGTLDDIVSADRRATDVIRRLRDLLGRGEPRREGFLLEDAIHRVLRLLDNEIDEQGVTVDLRLVSGSPEVRADRLLVEQALLNLVNNACEAVAGNALGERRISVTTDSDAENVLVDVTDNGCGLSDPDKIFEAFYSTKPGGLGMGLNIVRSIVRSHDGHVWAESGPGRGTTIHLSLPRDGAAA